MKQSKLYMVLRILFGLLLIFFGLNGFFQFFPVPEMNELATRVSGALFETGYIFKVVPLVFLLSGLAFLFDKWTALMAIILVPITVNIIFFHIFLEPVGILIPIVMVVLNFYILWMNKSKLKPLLAMN